jgi:alkanesulfonate monooxygenase SsuD/methylene tetrahydromethanopterin reductase-like flavin-dependent oxidoreductase (luciferase family)
VLKLRQVLSPPPPLDPWQELCWRAFADLTTERPYVTVGSAQTAIVASPGPIRFGAVTGWLDEAGIRDPDRRAALRALVDHLDRLWLDEHAQRTRGHA